jgi:uncharacterized LabA/DUF88 family protein
MERDEVNKVAIYWDFENIHASLANEAFGEEWYRNNNNRFSPQPPLIDVNPILDYAASLGDIAINKAYGNWQWFGNYRHAMNATGIDLIQMFPRGQNSKNSADIRMALDALSDIHIHGHINHVVIVSSDSDFISLAQKIKQAGKFVAAVGVERYTNRFFIAACNEFKFYHSLVDRARPPRPADNATASVPAGLPDGQETPSPSQEPVGPLSLEHAKEALQKALLHLTDRLDGAPIPKASLKHAIKRLQPSFDEKALGFSNFSAFIDHFSDIVTVVDTVSGGHVEAK